MGWNILKSKKAVSRREAEATIEVYQPARKPVVTSTPPPAYEPPNTNFFQIPATLLNEQARAEAPPPPKVIEPVLVVGIDFGTTSTGVAYAMVTDVNAVETVITNWPGANNSNIKKIPSVVWYDADGKVIGWGKDTAFAEASAKAYKRDESERRSFEASYYKLLLENWDPTYEDFRRSIRLPPNKTALDVASDFLTEVRKVTEKELIRTFGEPRFKKLQREARYFLTVPAVWSDVAKSATRQAAVNAGFVDSMDNPKLSLIVEPEAAAIFCAKRDVYHFETNDVFLVVDCGGGTVDLIAYEVEDSTPSSFLVKEFTTGTGAVCGSVLVDTHFNDLVKAKVQYLLKMNIIDNKMAANIRRRCRKEFPNIKHNFKNDPNIDFTVETGVAASHEGLNLFDGDMTFTPEEILMAFQSSVSQVVSLVHDQIRQVQDKGKFLKAILVVGGYGSSSFLFASIQQAVPQRYRSCVLRPKDSVAAIVNGAVVTGIFQDVLKSRVARRHYCMETVEDFIPGCHRMNYMEEVNGKKKCKYTQRHLVKKGQEISIHDSITIPFFREISYNSSRIFTDKLYTCDATELPQYVVDPGMVYLTDLVTDLSAIGWDQFQKTEVNGKTLYRIYFDIVLAVDGGNEIKAEFVFNSDVRGKVNCKF
ncbi:hypothetical protein V1512DRAFT_268758 [Lipomyces arxii]|uniref:uncharacterized protein n=1 Tax=Lipomyces arxii TaxID=56418 RepID=UPI0034CDF8B6